MQLTREHGRCLLRIARDSIERSWKKDAPGKWKGPNELYRPGAAFVTLTLDTKLRGCIGSTTPSPSLADTVERHSYAAAFKDPRFPPLERKDGPRVHIEISVLSGLNELFFRSEEDLIEQLRAERDGLLIESGRYNATFLPTVWKAHPEPAKFLRQLKRKAELPSDDFPYRAWRYTCQSFGEREAP